ncbi:MAG: hypothetical protein OES12_14355 [Anaerolineae bacterium]|nr:hypothetical protein [Anaerolineae bacterium]
MSGPGRQRFGLIAAATVKQGNTLHAMRRQVAGEEPETDDG